MDELFEQLAESLSQVTGYIYPNEIELHWALLIVIYPYITGLVAGAFILASLEKVFKVKELEPTYRLAMLTALAFLIVAPMPLLAHLGHPERSFEIFLTPHLPVRHGDVRFRLRLVPDGGAAARDLVRVPSRHGALEPESERDGGGLSYRLLSLGSRDISAEARGLRPEGRPHHHADRHSFRVSPPRLRGLHLRIGQGQPLVESVLMPIVFLFSAIVSGIALVLLLYYCHCARCGGKTPDMSCLDKLASFLLYALIVDFSLEILDFIHRLYESEESIKILSRADLQQALPQPDYRSDLARHHWHRSLLLAITRFSRLPEELKRVGYFIAALLVQVGIFSTRWNVVIGGQLFSKSLRGLTVYKMELVGAEGLLTGIGFLILPFLILFVLVKLLPPWEESRSS